MTIHIKSVYGNWIESSKEKAQDYIEWLIKNLPGISDDKKISYIESERLKGITVEELCKK